MHPMPLDRPIFVTGTPRSGKSCIASLLACDPAFYYAGEPLQIWETGVGRRGDDRRGADEATEALRRRIEPMCEELLAAAGRQRYVDAFSYHALRIPFLAALLPQARIIHVIRSAERALPEMIYGWTFKEPMINTFKRRRQNLHWRTLPRLAVRFLKNHVLSHTRGLRATWGPRVPGLAAFATSHSAAEIAAFQWMRMVEIAMDDLATLPPERRLEVRFENLLKEPAEEIRRIAAFAQVDDVDAFVAQATAFIEPDRVFKKVVEPTESEWASIGRLIGPLNQRLNLREPQIT